MRTWILIAASATLLCAVPVHGQEPTTQEREHRVKEGDTLWDLAQLYYESPWLWQRIFEANTDVVEDPHWIYPEERLVIPGLAEDFPAQPRREVRRPTRTRFYTAPAAPVQRETQPTILSEETRTPMLVRPGDFYTAPWLTGLGDRMVVLGRLTRTDETADISWRMTETAQLYDDLYLTYRVPERPAVGDRLMLVNLGRRIGDHQVVEPVAFVEVRRLEPELMVARIVRQFGAVTTGALAIPLDSFPEPVQPQPDPVEGGVEGTILGFGTEQNLYGAESLAFLDLGAQDGIRLGDELVVIQPERSAGRRMSQDLPSQVVAELRVVRVRELTSTARVFDVVTPVLEPGLPVRVVRKMP